MRNENTKPDAAPARQREAQQEAAANSPVKTPAAGRDMPDARTQATGFARQPLTPEAIAAKTPTGLPPVERGAHAVDSDDPVRRAASRIATLDNANMATTDNTVDVDGKGREAAVDASKLHDNVIHSNASLDDSVDTPAAGLGGIESRPAGSLPQVAARPGWRVRHVGHVDVEVEHGAHTRAEHLIRFERVD